MNRRGLLRSLVGLTGFGAVAMGTQRVDPTISDARAMRKIPVCWSGDLKIITSGSLLVGESGVSNGPPWYCTANNIPGIQK